MDTVLHVYVYVRKLGRIGKLICKIYLKKKSGVVPGSVVCHETLEGTVFIIYFLDLAWVNIYMVTFTMSVNLIKIRSSYTRSIFTANEN